MKEAMGTNYVGSKTGVAFLAAQLLLFPLILLCLATRAHAADINAASCSDTNVQSAINSASSGDRVIVPSGSCTWNSTVNIANKRITLQGQGIGVTNITGNEPGGSMLNITGASAINFVRITGFTLTKGADNSYGNFSFSGTLFQVAFRFDHNRVVVPSATSAHVLYTENVYGLIDHNTFDVTASSGSIQSISVYGSNDGLDGGYTPWTQPFTPGTINAVYIEDNTFNYGSNAEDAVDAYGGARLVFRHNTTNRSIGFHGFDSGGRRSPHTMEIYNNTFQNGEGIRYRGGTGVIFNNTGTGSVQLMSYRSCGLDGSSLGFWGPYPSSNQYGLTSTNPSNNGTRTFCRVGIDPGCTVKFCSLRRDTLCTSDSDCAGGGGTCSTFGDGSGTGGYPGRDQVGVATNQVTAPIYFWNNGGMSIATFDGGTGCNLTNIIQLNRDYFVGTVMPGYTAFTYPHPLQGASTTPPPPTKLTAVVN